MGTTTVVLSAVVSASESPGVRGSIGGKMNDDMWDEAEMALALAESEKTAAPVAGQAATEAALEARCRTLGLTTARVPGDGECLFHAIALQIGTTGCQLRKAVVEFVERGGLLPQYNVSEDKIHGVPWVVAMRKQFTYGDEVAILAVARMTGKTVRVVSSTRPTVEVYPGTGKGNVWLRHIQHGADQWRPHFDALLPAPAVAGVVAADSVATGTADADCATKGIGASIIADRLAPWQISMT
jgi:hypothetical protein